MNDLKIFIYDNDGNKKDEKDYDLLGEIIDNTIKFNLENLNNPYNLYVGKEFPPKDYVWDNLIKNWKNDNNEELKIFIYDSNGQKINEKKYSQFLDTYTDTEKHNDSNFYNQYFMYYGSQFPPKDHVWDENTSDWIKQTDKIETLEEIPIEQVLDNQNSTILKIYVYNIRGEKIKEDFYSNFLDIYDFVLNHNSLNPNEPYNIYPGTQFPPKGYKWSNDKLDWVELSLYEKYVRGELDIPHDCIVIGNTIVRKNLSQLYKENKISISPTQKIDEELNIIVDKNQQELIDEGLADWEEIYKNEYAKFKNKIDQNLDLYYFKYPKSIIFQFSYKSDLAQKWKKLSVEERDIAKTYNFNEYSLLMSEFKNINKNYTSEEIMEELDVLSEKILNKKNEIDAKLGYINNFFNSLHQEMLALKNERNYFKVFDFISNIENRISQWIKS